MLRFRTCLLLSFALLLSCGKSLPKPTQTGKNTFGCNVDGKKWVPDGGPGFQGAKPIAGGFFQLYDGNKPYIGVFLRAHRKDGQYIHLLINDYKTGTYELNQTTAIMPFCLSCKNYGYFAGESGEKFVTSTQAVGYVKITRSDLKEGILSGEFEFKASNGKTPSKQVTIQKGRFDINVFTLP